MNEKDLLLVLAEPCTRSTATAPAPVEPPRTVADALAQIDRWLWRLAAMWGPRVRVSSQDFHHELTVSIFLAFRGWDNRKGKLTAWAVWQARATASRLLAERYSRRVRVASQSERLTTRLATTPARTEQAGGDRGFFTDAEIREKVAALKPREAQAVRLRFGLDGEAMTLEAVGQEMGLTKERARQLVVIGVEKLREKVFPTG